MKINWKFIGVIAVLGMFLIAVASFYQIYVVEQWGDLFHVPWNVWISWIFWVVLGIFLLLGCAVVLLLMLVLAEPDEEEEEAPREIRKTKSKPRKKVKPTKKLKQKRKPKLPEMIEAEPVFISSGKEEKVCVEPSEKKKKEEPEFEVPEVWEQEDFE